MAENLEIFRVAIKYSAPGASIANTVHWYQFQGPGLSDALVNTDIISWITNDWGPDWAAVASNQAAITGVEIDVINPDGTVKRNSGAASLNIPGTVVSNVLPAANSALFVANTPLPKQKGKKYIPFLSEGGTDSGVINASTLTNLSDLFADYVANLVVVIGSDLVAGVLSRVLEAFVAFPGGGTITDLPSYQRRRKQNVGS